MGWKSTLKAIQAAERRQQRDAQKRLRELERQAKEQAKLSAIEQARLEVATFESGLEVLLSVHKERSDVWDWIGLVSALPPHQPRRFSRHELKAKQAAHQAFEEACAQDERDFQEELRSYEDELAEWEKMKAIARRILAGEDRAYTEALVGLSALTEISDLGSALHFTIHNSKLVECRLKVNGRQAIPQEFKTLTATGKVSVKPMPKARFHEIYQDYVCGCVLRVGREVFALLPIKTVLITASVDALDPTTGQTAERAVLSVAFSREPFDRLDFQSLDPSDALESFPHRGDAKASRKSGEFDYVQPLTPADLELTFPEEVGFEGFLAKTRELRNAISVELGKLNPQSGA